MRIWRDHGMNISVKDDQEIAIMREGGKILGQILHEASGTVKAGNTTEEINKVVEHLIDKYNVRASFKGFNGFPASVCVCINNEVVHGIPGDAVLKDGDIVTLDCGVFHKGFHTDSALTLPVGKVSEDVLKLIKTAEMALQNAIKIAQPGIKTGDLGIMIQQTVEKQGFSIIHELTGHGIGQNVHEDPPVFNFNNRGHSPILQPGMTIAIEPIISAGGSKIKLAKDGWTYLTMDNSLATQAEHTIAITGNGAEILTKRPS